MADTDDQFKDAIIATLEPVGGRKVIHTLTNAEIEDWLDVELAEADHYDAAELLNGTAKADSESDPNWRHPTGQPILRTQLIDDFLRTQTVWRMARENFWYKIRRGRNCWNERLEIAAGFKVVSNGPKYYSQ